MLNTVDRVPRESVPPLTVMEDLFEGGRNNAVYQGTPEEQLNRLRFMGPSNEIIIVWELKLIYILNPKSSSSTIRVSRLSLCPPQETLPDSLLAGCTP